MGQPADRTSSESEARRLAASEKSSVDHSDTEIQAIVKHEPEGKFGEWPCFQKKQ